MSEERAAEPIANYDILVFDWDGTAVPDRDASAEEVDRMIAEQLRRGRSCVIVTGTKADKIERQLFPGIPPEVRNRLFLCVNRGSEVYGYDEQGKRELLFRRVATPGENTALDRAAESLRRWLSGFCVDSEIVRQRLNRRKVDLIPIDKWRDPPKAAIRELLRDVESRLMNGHIQGGLGAVIDHARRFARAAGLEAAKITSDIKHVEIGLTDKADSLRWVLENLVRRPGIMPERVAILGDEFGTVGGRAGSDSLMRIPGLEAAAYFSVGAEPEGVPEGVIHLPGGPGRFMEFLKGSFEPQAPRDAALRASLRERMCTDSSWLLVQEGFDPAREREMESLFTVGNGRLGVRGGLSLEIPFSQGDSFVSGIYDQKVARLPYSELEFLTPDRENGPLSEIVSFPFPFRLSLEIAGQSIIPTPGNVRRFSRILCLRTGILAEEFGIEPLDGVMLELRTARCCPLERSGLLLQEAELVVHSREEVSIELNSSLEDPDLELRHPHLKNAAYHLEQQEFSEMHQFETRTDAVRVVFATRTWLDGAEVKGTRRSLRVKGQRTLRLEKVIAVASSMEGRDPKQEVVQALRRLAPDSFRAPLDESLLAWGKFWEVADVRMPKSPVDEQAQRFGAYHLRIGIEKGAAHSISARTLTGRAYEGHIFWDAEVFILPFYLYRDPALARACLDYRHRTLAGARERAQRFGCRGASFAWESAVTGEDVTPRIIFLKGTRKEVPIFTGEQQIHITGDVAWAIWRYWQATLDSEWMRDRGARVLFETARFWVSRVKEHNGKYHLRRVIGPDEYHTAVDDNAYTNWMARFNLEKALETAAWMREAEPAAWGALRDELGLGEAELSDWDEVRRRLFIPQPDRRGVIEQFSGFHDLKHVPLPDLGRLKAPVGRLLAWEETNRMQILKQADVLMIPFLFPDAFSAEVLKANYEFYEPRTEHGSSLSPGVHAAIAARIGNWDHARRYWDQSVRLDLGNLMQNTALGVHAGSIGATWQALIFHILDLAPEGVPAGARVERRLIPERWSDIQGKLLYRGANHSFGVAHPKEKKSA